jgi:hypothetical protein
MTKTIRPILLFITLFVSTCLFAQNNPLRNDTISADQDMQIISTKVSMEIDGALFPKTQGSMFFSDKPRAMIMPMVMRSDFDKIDEKKLLDETAQEMDMKIKKKGSFTKKDKKVIYLIGKTSNQDGEIIMEVYFVKGDASRTIMITGFYESSAKKIYKKSIKNAALTAKLD